MMTIECIGPPFIYRWPGGEVHLQPGKPIDLPDERAQRLLSKAPGKVRVIQPTIHAGDRITWQRAGTVKHGMVDYLHVDDTGTRWAFVTLPGDTWTAVNCKFARVTTDADLTRVSTAKAPTCFACQSTRWWVSIHGAVVCGECHPPAGALLVKEWIG